jgi:hypothetical protein
MGNRLKRQQIHGLTDTTVERCERLLSIRELLELSVLCVAQLKRRSIQFQTESRLRRRSVVTLTFSIIPSATVIHVRQGYMRKAGVLSILFVLVLLAVSSMVEGQQPNKIPRIGYLSAVDPAIDSIRSEPIRQALADRGYIEGQNIAFEYRYAEGKQDRLPVLAAELVRQNVDIIVVSGGTGVIRTAKNATKTILSLC